MEHQLFNTAIKNGQYVSIDEFTTGEGLRCGCICPECGEAVVSNVTAKQRCQLKRKFTNHFSHYDENSTCTGGHGETEIHLFAKKVVEENNSLVVPSFGEERKQLSYTRSESEPAFPVGEYKQKRPDLLLYDNSGVVIMAIEIVVTNPVSQEKKSLYEEAKLRCLSINLSFYYSKDLKTFRDKIKSDIIRETRRKEWIWTDEKPVKIEELAEVDEEGKSQMQSKNGSSGINPLGVVIAAVVGYVFRKPILNFIKKVLKG